MEGINFIRSMINASTLELWYLDLKNALILSLVEQIRRQKILLFSCGSCRRGDELSLLKQKNKFSVT